MEDDGIIGDALIFYTKEVNLEYYMARDEERHPEIVNVKYYGSLENSEIKNLMKSRQTEIGRTIDVPWGKCYRVLRWNHAYWVVRSQEQTTPL